MIRVEEKFQEIDKKLIERRRDFHQYPEPAWTEFRSASIIIKLLEKWGYDIKFGADVIAEEGMMGVPSPDQLEKEMERAIAQGADKDLVEKMAGGKTGVVADLVCGEGPVVALRFDMDSNDILEAEDDKHRPYKEGFASKNPGAMHACGHDGHMTIGLGTAEYLASIKDQLQGTVRFIFQPAEEGVRGARAMVEAGVVDGVDYIISGHLGFKAQNTGDFIASSGKFLATTKLDVNFYGKPAHAGAAPQEGKNALLAAATAALNMHAISRHGDGASRINVGVIQAGQGRNILPPNGTIKLETRGETGDIDAYMVKEVERMAEAAAKMYDCTYDIKMTGQTVSGESDPEVAEVMRAAAEEIDYFKNIVDYEDFGAAEDYAALMSAVQKNGGKGTYYMIGADRKAGHHDNYFDFDEDALAAGVRLNSLAVTKMLAKK